MKQGKAYGIFDCSASKEQIEAELPTVRRLTKIPSKLELSLIEGVDSLRGVDSRLDPIIENAKKAGMRYILEATYPNAINRETADELSAVLNQAYQSPLYQEGEKFRGAIVYEENREYVFRDKKCQIYKN